MKSYTRTLLISVSIFVIVAAIFRCAYSLEYPESHGILAGILWCLGVVLALVGAFFALAYYADGTRFVPRHERAKAKLEKLKAEHEDYQRVHDLLQAAIEQATVNFGPGETARLLRRLRELHDQEEEKVEVRRDAAQRRVNYLWGRVNLAAHIAA
jgi:multidrug resistance efflux pump